MIAGIGGASLGTEIDKCLYLAGGYEIHGCDISATAYGLYADGFASTQRVARENYAGSVIAACRKVGARWLVPGGEQPAVLLSAALAQIEQAGLALVANDAKVVALCSNKELTFVQLAESKIAIPRTAPLSEASDVARVGLPCVVKPATGSGGSAMVFLASSVDDAMVYAGLIRRSGGTPIAQEYVDVAEGEFTVGVLTLPDGRPAGSMAMRRALDTKLSVAFRSSHGVISSGYSQGRIDEYREICRQAEHISRAVGSRGPLNIQGRVRNGVLLPFEINPRFSASAYLRALAGFNEVDIFLRNLILGTPPPALSIKPGWYLRSLSEIRVAEENLK